MSTMIERTQETGNAQRGAGAEMGVSRVAAEVQAAMVIARKFPRDEVRARERIRTACSRQLLAADAVYEFPRGKQKVTGPSIRLLEVIAQNWGNLDFGWVEVERRPGSSTVLAYSWDLETNTRSTKVFDVPHKRDTKEGSYALTDDRDIYERVANDAARRVRSCLEGVIPGDVIEEAVGKCHHTLIGKSDEPLVDRAVKMVEAFKAHGVTLAMIEAKLAHPVGSITPHELARLARVFTAIRDGIGKVGDHFDLSPATTEPTDGATSPSKAKTLDEYTKAAEASKSKGDGTTTDKTREKNDADRPDFMGEFAKELSACTTKKAVEALTLPKGFTPEENTRALQMVAAKLSALSASRGEK